MAAPNPTGAWRKALAGRSSAELLTLRAEVDDLCEQPAFHEIRSLLTTAHDELMADLVSGPANREAAEYAKQTGTVLGLEGLQTLIEAIRHAAGVAESRLNAEADRSRSRMELVG